MPQAQDRRIAGSLACGAAVFAFLTLVTGTLFLAVTASGLLVGALMAHRRTLEPRPYWDWPAWLTGATVAALLATAADEAARLMLLPLAAAEAIIGLVLLALWSHRRHGRGDWIVWLPETGVTLRREWSRRAATHWAQTEWHGPPCAISPAESFPEAAAATPLYPYRDRPGITGLRSPEHGWTRPIG
ncbi:hypothetical protein GTW69_32890 [Streptomyces sp. SID7760]|nr:hypothetical protein [Streptomyces sp. SID7760]